MQRDQRYQGAPPQCCDYLPHQAILAVKIQAVRQEGESTGCKPADVVIELTAPRRNRWNPRYL